MRLQAPVTIRVMADVLDDGLGAVERGTSFAVAAGRRRRLQAQCRLATVHVMDGTFWLHPVTNRAILQPLV
jgi:hypothetical protein